MNQLSSILYIVCISLLVSFTHGIYTMAMGYIQMGSINLELAAEGFIVENEILNY